MTDRAGRRRTTKKKRTAQSAEAQATTDDAADERDETGSGALFPIVGIGASAGGLEALTELLAALPRKTGMGFVLVQHLDPDHESALTEILARATSLPVREITNDERVRVDHVYVIPPDAMLTIADGVLKIQRRHRTGAGHRSIDTFFESLAQDQRERAVGVVLSGTANDGTMGLEAIKAEGGITFAQDDSAKHNSMPRSAVAAGCVDLILSPEDIAKELVRIASHPSVSGQSLLTSATTPAQADQVDAAEADSEEELGSDNAQIGYKKILLLLRSHSGVDFSLYKPATMRRRVARRLVLNQQSTLHDYAGFLRGNAKELDALYSDLLISVTSFFRNPETFDVLQHKILPELLKQRGDDPLRFWVLGCSTGQEAYSIAMAFVEAAEKAHRTRKLKVFATDLNEAMLEKARQGLYPKSLVADITPQRLQRFFVEEDGGYRIDKGLRNMVVFARQNLTADPPFSRVDLVSCRNVLIYLEPNAQKKAMPTFHYALKPGGFLLLGASESIGNFTRLFEPVDRKHKIYSKKPASILALQLQVREKHGEEPPVVRTPVPNRPPGEALAGELNPQREADRVTLSEFAPPGVLVNAELQVLEFRGATDAFLQQPAGKPSFDVLRLARDGLMLPLRSAINQAKKENKTGRKENVRVKRNGKTRTINLVVIPLKNLREPCFLILFEEAEKASGGNELSKPRRARAHRSPSGEEKSRIAELETELSETREYLQSIQEQLETSNEEFQASNEEVQSANEELQSSNEELETSKEELESTNEELTTVNEELSCRNVELNRVNSDLVNLQASGRVAIVLLGHNLNIRRFGPHAEKQFNLIIADIGRPIGHLRHNLVLGDAPESALDLEGLCAEVVSGGREQEREVRDTGGHWYSLRVRPYRTLDNRVDGVVIVVVDIDTLKRSEQAVRESEARYRVMFESTNMGVCETDAEAGRLLRVNEQFARIIGYTAAELVGKTFLELTHPDDRLSGWEGSRSRLVRGEIPFYETEKRLIRKDGTNVWVHVAVNLVRDAASRPLHTVVITLDITERKRAEEALRETAVLERQSAEAERTRLRDLLKQVPATINFLRGPELVFEFAHPNTLKALGGRDVLGKPLLEAMPEHRGQGFAEMLERVYRTGEPIVGKETLAKLDRKGTGVLEDSYWNFSYLPVRSPFGDVEGVMTFDIEVTDLVLAREQTQRSLAGAESANRSKDEFLAMLGHELRNPLAPMQTALELLRQKLGTAGERERQVVERQVQHLVRLVDDLLDVSRIARGAVELHKQPVEVSAVLANAIEMSAPLLEARKHKLTVSAPPAGLSVDADASRLEQVFSNLLTNAAKYMEPGGQIAITAHREGPDAVVQVVDQGIGIAAELLPRIFELFVQERQAIDRARGGMGLGLAIVRNLLTLHGGTVTARSEGLGRGSAFTVRLPALTIASTPPPPLPQPAVVEADEVGRRVLIVDDNEDAALLLADSLTACGHATRVAHNGPQALRTFDEFHPEVVLLDIGLPVMDGFEVAQHLRAKVGGARPRIIALTGYGQAEDRIRTRDAGFDAHLVKPIDLTSLKRALASVPEGPQE